MDWYNGIPFFHVADWAAYAMIPIALVALIARAYHEE
jgi:hypothetical protein